MAILETTGMPTHVEGTPSSSSSSNKYWALDSNNGELDPALKAAHKEALKRFHSNDPIELEEPIVLRNLLSEEQIEEILKEASVQGVWPRGVPVETEKEPTSTKTTATAGAALSGVPHHFAWTEEHVALYMHNNDHWFVRTLPVAWGIIRGGMESRPWMDGAIPVLDESFLGIDTESMMRVRTVELHHYSVGGGLVTPGHCDCGSDLTISVLLSDPAAVTGGDFVTYRGGVPIAHKMGRGDAILFPSEKLHNISTVTSGLRQSLVVELWPSNDTDFV